MNCTDFRELLDDEPDAERQGRMFAHASACPACQSRLEFEALARRQLRTLPIPAPRPGFSERVLRNAHRAHRAQRRPALREDGRWRWIGGALAASLTLALGVWLAQAPEQAAVQVVRVAPGQPAQVQPVQLVFRSDTALTGVTIELRLPESVELAGYPGQRQLSWQTNLQSGTNVLDLPVLVSGSGGVLTATLNLGDERRQFSVRVQAASGGTGPSRG